jgi:hypothetical protein
MMVYVFMKNNTIIEVARDIQEGLLETNANVIPIEVNKEIPDHFPKDMDYSGDTKYVYLLAKDNKIIGAYQWFPIAFEYMKTLLEDNKIPYPVGSVYGRYFEDYRIEHKTVIDKVLKKDYVDEIGKHFPA